MGNAVRAKAKAVGFYGGSLRQVGDVFEVPEGAKGSWFDLVEPPVEKKSKPEKPAKPVADDLV